MTLFEYLSEQNSQIISEDDRDIQLNLLHSTFFRLGSRVRDFHNSNLIANIDSTKIELKQNDIGENYFDFSDYYKMMNGDIEIPENIKTLAIMYLGGILTANPGMQFEDYSKAPAKHVWAVENFVTIKEVMNGIVPEQAIGYLENTLINGNPEYYDMYVKRREKEDVNESQSMNQGQTQGQSKAYTKVLSNGGPMMIDYSNNQDQQDSKQAAFINAIFYPTLCFIAIIVVVVIYNCFTFLLN